MEQQGVLITGATSGIGEQLALDYARAGWNVLACGRNESSLQSISQQASGITPLAFDITNYEETIAQLKELPFVPNLWIFNAGDCEYLDDGKVDAKLIVRIMRINVEGLANCLEGCQIHLKEGHHVGIVGSIASEFALPRAEAYGASKAAVMHMAESLRVDMRRSNVAVQLVNPGFIRTRLTDKNNFAMPFIMDPAPAADIFLRHMRRKKFSCSFPWGFGAFFRVSQFFPDWLYYRIF